MIKAAIIQAKDEIIGEIDLVAAANVNACAQSAVINFKDIDALSQRRDFWVERYTCTAYDGTTATAGAGHLPTPTPSPSPSPSPNIDRVAVQNQATANTSRAIAQKAVLSI